MNLNELTEGARVVDESGTEYEITKVNSVLGDTWARAKDIRKEYSGGDVVYGGLHKITEDNVDDFESA